MTGTGSTHRGRAQPQASPPEPPFCPGSKMTCNIGGPLRPTTTAQALEAVARASRAGSG